jgi:lipase chaperone LimK
MLMDSDKINGLLQKYWNTETSLEEEQLLRDYFSKEKVPEGLTEAAELFQYFESQKKMGVEDSSFEKTIRSKTGARGNVISMVQIARIAAGLLVVAAATFFIREEVRKAYPDEPEDTYSDPKVAFEETKKALMMISNSFGKAQKQASKINVFNEAQEKIQSPAAIDKTEKENEKKTNI